VSVEQPSWWGVAFAKLSSLALADIAVVRWQDGSDAVVELANPGAAALLDLTPEDVVGRAMSEIYPAAYLAEVAEQFRRAREHGAYAYEVVRELPAGRRTLDAVTVALGDDRYLSFAIDRTAEREAQRRLDEVTRLTGAGLYHWNLADDEVSWTDELYRLFGYEPGEVAPSTDLYLEHVHPDDREPLDDATAASRTGERMVAHTRHRIVRADGEERTVDVRSQSVTDRSGALLYVTGVVRDVTGEIELERHAELLRRAAEQQGTALTVHDRVVQALATVVLALDLDQIETARAEASSAVDAAQQVVADLLTEVGAVQGRIAPGSLRVPGQGSGS
jgi:PAS domain S-box-containing protein